jgi:uncharacterized membrane protein
LRLLLAMPLVETARPFSIAGGAVAVFLVLLWLVRLAKWLVARLANKFARILPSPQALLVSILLTAIIRGGRGISDQLSAP